MRKTFGTSVEISEELGNCIGCLFIWFVLMFLFVFTIAVAVRLAWSIF